MLKKPRKGVGKFSLYLNPNRMKSVFGGLLTLSLALALIAIIPGGCASPAYYGQAVSGHLSMMTQREDIDQLLNDSELDEETRQKLELALEMREFASSGLALPDNESYRQYVETGRSAVTWNVIATPEFSLEPKRWCFLVAGCVPYRGYFKQQAADNFADSLRKKSLDVHVSPAIAYSTLGWFDDPLLDTMLQYNEEQLAGLIFHELAHQQLYVKNDSTFNESYASYVEEIGIVKWNERQGREPTQTDRAAREAAWQEFFELLKATREELITVFSSGRTDVEMRSDKRAIYEAFRENYRKLVEQSWDGVDYFPSWLQQDINNARFALIETYLGGECAFKNLYEEAGRDIVRFQRKAAEKASLDREQRTAWLQQSCEPGKADSGP